jgi:hypothetical protein
LLIVAVMFAVDMTVVVGSGEVELRRKAPCGWTPARELPLVREVERSILSGAPSKPILLRQNDPGGHDHRHGH